MWTGLEGELSAFGKESGLFDAIDVRYLGPGKKMSDPFQIQVKVRGQHARTTLIDVGYGVSQVLPILVDGFLRQGEFLLMQQPEVHLHPRAQAALGTFLGRLVSARRTRVVVETHSDYLVDRIRLAVRAEKGLRQSHVSILYFERANGGVMVHPMTVDAHGNLLGAPAGYRDFFIKEELSLVTSNVPHH